MSSHSPRSGWIEIASVDKRKFSGAGPTPHGVGGLKFLVTRSLFLLLRPTPHGVGGLK